MGSTLLSKDLHGARPADERIRREGPRSAQLPAMIDFAARVTVWFEEHMPR